ncbi:RDD family protein [candidate division WOR-3 bacterium]|nr:RDD family protein [candidate division WOR-3 bacterium]
MNQSQTSKDSKGYISHVAKKKFTIIAGILGAVFFIGQFFIPMLALLLILPWQSEKEEIRSTFVEDAVLWKDSIWYIETITKPTKPTETKEYLMMLEPESETEPKRMSLLPIEGLFLLPDSNSLWVISNNGIAYYQNNSVIPLPLDKSLGSIIPYPFIYEGTPAVFEVLSDSILVLQSYKNRTWNAKDSISVVPKENLASDFEILHINSNFHFFNEIEGTIYYWEGFPEKDKNIWNYWKPITKLKYFHWFSRSICNKPTFFYDKSDTLIGLIKEDTKWKKFFSYPTKYTHTFGIISLDCGNFIVLRDLRHKIEMCLIENGSIARTHIYEYSEGKKEMPIEIIIFIICFIYIIILILPFILALILTVQMPKYRITKYTNNIQFASLGRRTISQVIDCIIFIFPSMTIFIFQICQISDFVNLHYSIILLSVQFPWSIIILFIFGFLEGKWGVTPGKIALGIRVIGTDLKPCGFGRALIRNLLKFIDGFFNFIVGIMLIALTTNWQRIGDMAARTIVIRKSK